jgi:hypothetical protein
MTTRTHFSFRVDTWTPDGESIIEHVAPGGLIMDALISFFALRPTFTFLGLRVVWYIYLFNMLVQSYIAVSTIFRALAQKGISWEAWSPNFIPLILGIVVQLALVRIFLEVAAIIISNWQSRS